VGPPLAGVELRLVDDERAPVAPGPDVLGEVAVRGPNVFAGYWQSPAESAQAKAGEWLRTGDLGRIDEEGNIWITGRSKYVIVLDSGEKVLPDELEELFQQSELLWDMAVLPRQHRGKTQISAVVCPNAEIAKQRLRERGEPLSEESLRKLAQEEIDALSKSLAPFKRISEVTLTDTPLPRTAILKVMRAQLPETFTFDLKRWEQSAPTDLTAPSETPEPAADGAAPGE
jgi:long-subunit acyl-CoA synthetase (AMP-forming)